MLSNNRAMTSFIDELRRRNVLRVAAAYAVVAWIIIEAGSVLLPTFGASDSAFRVYVLVVVAGFIIALVMAWVLEVTPEGVKLEKNVDRSQSVTTRTGGRLDKAIIGLLAVALAISVTLNVTGLRDGDPGTEVDDSRLSIAVLPFESRSIEDDNKVFADGIHDDLLTRLANVNSLRVISRTSVMEYRGTTKNVRQIGTELGVGTILSATVQRVGDSVRINARLIDTTTDESIWARSYDREFSAEDIFSIQANISAEITGALEAQLTPDEQIRLASVPTESIAAYRLYTQGRANVYKRRLETLRQARLQFEEAAALDPHFAEAFVGIADSVLLLFNNHLALTREETLRVAGEALDKALALDPELADAQATLGLLKTKIWEETRSGPENFEAEKAYLRAIELNANHPRAYMWFASLRAMERRFDEAIDLYHNALRIDPLARVPYLNLPGLYAQLGRNEEALRQYLKAVQTHPDWPTAYQGLSQQLQGLGRIDEAIAWGLRARMLSTDPLTAANLTGAYVELGDLLAARGTLSNINEGHPMYALGAGIDLVFDEDFAGATAAFEQVYLESDRPRQFMYVIIPLLATASGDHQKARDYLERGNPDFVSDAGPEITAFNVASVVMYAYSLQQLGDARRADDLLERAMPVVESLPRLGIAGHGVRDAQILTLQGRYFEALAALRLAIDEGFRGTVFTNGWPIELDPYLTPLKGMSEYQEMMSELDALSEEMRLNVDEAQASGDWSELLALAESG